MICYNMPMSNQLGESFRQARRELRFQLITWTAFAAWVVGYGALNAYAAETENVQMTFGMPSWVMWGIAVPWFLAFVVTVYFAGWFMQDTELVDDADSTPATDVIAEDLVQGNG
jgi:hypothetical protein